MYGAQTIKIAVELSPKFENDVEMYGAQTISYGDMLEVVFENDVEMYGAQTYTDWGLRGVSLRMMQKCMVLKPGKNKSDIGDRLRMMQKCMVLKQVDLL